MTECTDLTHGLPTAEEVTKEFAQQIYHPAFKLLTATDPEVKDGTYAPNQFFAHGQVIKNPVIIIVHVRRHAILFENNQKTQESFDPNSPVYKDILEAVQERRGKYPKYVPREGLSFLIYIPEIAEFADFYPAAPTQRPCMGELYTYITPIENRTSDANKQKLFTRVFLMKSVEVPSKFKNKRPTPEALQALPEEFKDMSPNSEQLKQAIKVFMRPVLEEQENPVEEAEEDGDR